ncbi:hypothetical protein ACFFOS_10730 [Nocardioides kongjuensis]|uniref:Ig-like domain repeat protein n=1 Tax=Nocardioides kongjuensis TaxID=349522 RepID=A0A852RY60_9ACTN|nr:hypothetical protein [Nocardioides kongjuensis]NYD31492.1 hypothetical protein [Nocardioides kongjuensis]
MTLARTRLLGAGLAAALASGTLLAASPTAHAAPVFISATTSQYHDTGQASSCTNNSPAIPGTPVVPVAENGAPTATSVSTTAVFTNGGDPSDVLTNTATLQASSSVKSTNGLPTSITTSLSGTAAATATKGTSTCNAYASAGLELDFDLTTTVPLWATLTVTKKGPGFIESYIYEDNAVPYQDVYGRNLDGTGTVTVYLPPGHYRGYVEGDVSKRTATTSTTAFSGTASITFAPVGSASKAPSGKASKYVALPGTRACATHNATATLTTKKKRIKQIEKVTFSVNGKKAATLKGKKLKKGKAVGLGLADNAAADITATVALKNGKTRTVDASYLACTS